MKKLLFIALVVFGFKQNAQVLTQRICGTDALPQQYETWVQGLTTKSPTKFGSQNSIQSIFYIPVIVHVIHDNEGLNNPSSTSGGNLNAAQIQSQIDILNDDYNGNNTDTSLIPAIFKPLLGKFQVHFCLAVVNPTGGVLVEPGIDRINRNTKGWSAPPYSMTYADANIKPNSIWDPNRYLNIWVCRLSGSVLGYATFPNPGASGVGGLSGPFGSVTTDGVVISNTCFGNTGTSSFGQYNKGRTATHEIGHWMGLRHIWGDSNCGTDYCNDTPPAQASNYGCKNFPFRLGTCAGNTTGEMTMNYMDYSDDACLYMFSADQKKRAQLIMTNSPLRASLITSTVCNLPNVGNDVGVSSVSQPTYSQSINCSANNTINPVVNITNYGSTTLTSALLSFNVNGVNTQTMIWTGNLLPGASTTVALTQISNLYSGLNTFSVNISSPNGGTDNNLINNNSLQQFWIVNSFTLSVNSATVCSGVSANLVASGAPSYTWSSGSNNASISPNPVATTVYTVTGGSGFCVASKTTAVVVNTIGLNVQTTGVNLSCASCIDGSVIATVSNGTGPYTFAWTPVTNTTNSITGLPEGCYTVTVTDTQGCSGTSAFCVSFDTGISGQKLSGETIKIMPNPNKGSFILEFTNDTNRQIEIVDVLGRTIRNANSVTNSITIDIAEVSGGIYYVKVNTEKGMTILKMVKE